MGLLKKFKLIGTEVLAVLLTADGEGSQLDSDLLDGKHYDDIMGDTRKMLNDSMEYVNSELEKKSDKTHTHTAAQVGAAPANHTHTAAQVGAATAGHTHTDKANTNLSNVENTIFAQKAAAAGIIAEAVDLSGKADVDHNHDGVYQPVGDYADNELSNVTATNIKAAVERSGFRGGAANILDGSATGSVRTIYSQRESYYECEQKQMGRYAFAEGAVTQAIGEYSHAEGHGSKAVGNSSHAEGSNTTANALGSHAEGSSTEAGGQYSHAEGSNTNASGNYSHAGGYGTIAKNYQTAIGKYNKESNGPTYLDDTIGDIFIIGNGTSDTAKNNALRTTTAGKTYGLSAFASSGADYAEYFEWQDGNQDNEDRRGLFVTLDGEKIRKATPEDNYILGIVSAFPGIEGDSQSEIWKDMYQTDVFGEKLTETVEVPEATDEMTGEIIPAHTEIRWVLNPSYDPEQEYIRREDRPEWAPIGLLGKLVVIDDGTCEVNGYCKVGVGGTATKADGITPYRVMSRLDDTHIRVFIK